MPPAKYNMSFTACPLLWQDSVKIASLFLEMGDWNLVKTFSQQHNVLQARMASALDRIKIERKILSRKNMFRKM